MALMLFGHRGAAGEAPENTLVGFEHAYKTAKVRCFELDVHLTKDKKLAVIHDGVLDRTTDGKGPISAYSLEELKRFDAGVLFKNRFAGSMIPSLDEVLTIYADSIASFQIEIKTDTREVLDEVARMVLNAIQRYKIKDKTVVTSFDQYALECILKNNPSQRCGLIAMNYTARDLETALRLGCFNTCVPITAPEGADLVAAARAKGLQTTGWLGNTPQDVDVLLKWNVDSITSNYPSSVRAYLRDTKRIECI
jgi:glycerophosphoryl diester phosphodiesterase